VVAKSLRRRGTGYRLVDAGWFHALRRGHGVEAGRERLECVLGIAPNAKVAVGLVPLN
jgi:hypothetical protein